MKTIIYKKENYSVSKWSGGETTELAIFPYDKKYADRDFTFRVSSATVELEESDFTKLPDYDRIIMPLEGEVVLNYNGEKTVKLKELESDSFDGAWITKSYGKITDFNLMTRKGSEGHMDLIRPDSESVTLTSLHDESHEFKKMKETHVLYVKEGYAIVSAGETKGQMLQEGQTFIIEGDYEEELRYSIMGEGVVIRCAVCYESAEDEVGPVIIPPEKASFDDFKCAFFLANTQVRGSQYLFKRIQKTWYDEALREKIDWLEKHYITFIIYVLGAGIAISAGFNQQASDGTIVGILLLWTIIDSIIVSPAIYLAKLPKPIRKHIKDIDKLTPYEQRVREKQLQSNERVDKLLKKYKTLSVDDGRKTKE